MNRAIIFAAHLNKIGGCVDDWATFAFVEEAFFQNQAARVVCAEFHSLLATWLPDHLRIQLHELGRNA